MAKYTYHESQLMFDFDVVEMELESDLFISGDIDNIRAMIPQLRDHQCEDVARAEHRFEVGKGILFTNGTGVGKTYVGLGTAYRFFQRGKTEQLIVVPTDKKASDWVKDGAKIGLEIYQLKSTQDAGVGITVTTYANYYQNDAIRRREFNLVIYDESHYLLQNAKGSETVYLAQHWHICNVQSGCIQKAHNMMPFERPSYTDYGKIDNYYELCKKYDAQHLEIAKKLYDSTKVLYLSATPFAYHKSILYGDGTLWDINQTFEQTSGSSSYNEATGFSAFMVQHFGYRMKYNKLTIPESGVDVNLMERNFFETMNEKGIMFTRQIEIDQDYSRDFITIDSELGDKINSGIELFWKEDFDKKYPTLVELSSRKHNYNYISQLLECVKAEKIVPRIQQHLDLGRKVVVFHGYNNSVLEHPFHFDASLLSTEEQYLRMDLYKEMGEFAKEYPEYYNLDLSDLQNSRDAISSHFIKCRQFNGLVSKSKRKKDINEFNSDGGFVDLMLIQEKAGAEGLDANDTTGKFPRVLIQLGLPVQPTKSTQIEGRIFRDGLKSNAIYEYITLQTPLEQISFATKIAERARTVENLAMGNIARDLEAAFKEGYINSDYMEPHLGQGTGGKAKDRATANITPYQKAKTYYYARGKKTAKNKASEGIDYFATPEPLGLKILEWLNPKSNEHGMEPSAGHGAIARFFPGDTVNHFIEPSLKLFSEMIINSKGDGHCITFENHHRMNKYEFIAMNPPFGFSGKTAMEHLRKALVEHSSRRFDFRLIAIVPAGPAMDKRIEEFMESKEGQEFNIKWQLRLPSSVFERAGTNVSCKVLYFNKNMGQNIPINKIDLSYIKTAEEFFDAIEFLDL